MKYLARLSLLAHLILYFGGIGQEPPYYKILPTSLNK